MPIRIINYPVIILNEEKERLNSQRKHCLTIRYFSFFFFRLAWKEIVLSSIEVDGAAILNTLVLKSPGSIHSGKILRRMEKIPAGTEKHPSHFRNRF